MNLKHEAAMVIIAELLKVTDHDRRNPHSYYSIYNRTPSVAEARLKAAGYVWHKGSWIKGN